MAVKLTSRGYMSVSGIFMDNNIIENDDAGDKSNAWYQMKMVIDPVLHVNDHVRIISKITVMERIWTGGDQTNNAGQDYRSQYAGGNDWWIEQLFVAFPFLGGQLQVGRRPGGGWAYPYQDSKDNRDRILWIRRFGHITSLWLVEKLSEGDGGFPLVANPTGVNAWEKSHEDINAYAFGLVIPFSKNIVYRPLGYYVDYQSQGDAFDFLILQGLGLTFGAFKLEAEFNIRWRQWDDFIGDEDWEEHQLSGWVEGNFTTGPFTFGGGLFWLEGTDDSDPWNSNSIWGIGPEFQPLLLLTSEDVGVIWNTSGVSNGSAGASGYLGFYGQAAFKLSDEMKISGIVGYVEADEMEFNNVDDEIGWEVDLTFEWKFMPNMAYVVDAGYLMAGDYWSDMADSMAGGDDNDVFGIRHMLVINW
jgi:hypothetical protein